MSETTSLILQELSNRGFYNQDYVEFESYSRKYFHSTDNPVESFSSFTVNNSQVTASKQDIRVKDYTSFLSSVFSFSNSDLNDSKSLILPGIRYISDTLLVFERPPTLKPYCYSVALRESVSEDTNQQEYYIPIPWQVYVCSFDPTTMRLLNVKMYFTNNSLTSFKDLVYTPPLLNFYSNGTLCRPFFESMEDVEKYPTNYTGIMASAYDWIWNSGTNFDITENISYFLKSGNYKQFQKYVQDNSNSLIKYNFLEQNHLTSLPNQLNHKLVNAFFQCWSSVPISEICSFEWNTPSSNEFYFQDLAESNSNVYSAFLQENDFFIHESNFDHEEHDEDCPDECIYEEDVFNLDSFQTFKNDYLLNINSNKNLREVCYKAILYLYQQNFYKILSSQSQTNQAFNTAMKIAYSYS